MTKFNIDLREEWAQLPTGELERRLDSELEQQPPDDEIVLTILHILKSRQPETPLELTPEEAEAASRYLRKRKKFKSRKRMAGRLISVAASVALVLTLFFAVAPQKAEAETFWEMLQRITAVIMEYIGHDELLVDAESEYVFKTSNIGLQQVYNAVVGLGITEPVVPMWLPEGFELKEINQVQYPMSSVIHASFFNGNNEIIYKLDLYNGEPAHQFYKDDTHYECYEFNGTTYNITSNNNRWLVVWENKNIECSITLDCQEETLRRILRSIHVMEDG